MDSEVYEAVPADTPRWLKPYLAAALRSGLIAGWPDAGEDSFHAEQAVTGAEAAVMLQNALDLSISQNTLEAAENSGEAAEDVPAWAAVSLTAMEENGISLEPAAALTRGDAARILYQVSRLKANAPGMQVIRMQQ